MGLQIETSMIFFALASFIAVLGLSVAKLCRTGFASALCLTNFGIIGTLYLASMAGVLAQSVGFILLLALPAIFILLWGFHRDRQTVAALVRSPALLSYVAFVLFIYVWNVGRSFNHWDEFTHWGLVVKNMFIYDAFGNIPEATTFFLSYPPAASLYIYFFEKVNGDFSEPLAYMGHGILLFSILLGIFSGGFSRGLRQGIPVLLISLILPVIFYDAQFYSKLYVDALLGLLFALILVQYYSAKTTDFSLSVRLSLSIAILTLVKDSGAFLGCMALVIITIDFLAFSFPRNRRGLLWIAIPAMVCFLTRGSWLHYLNSTSMEMAWDNSHITFAGIRELAGNLPDYGKTTIVNFVTSFYEQFAVTLLATAGLLFGLTRLPAQENFAKRVPLLALGLLIGFGIYASSLLALYLFTFTAEEAVMIASFHRYLSTYTLGAVLAVLGIYAALLDLDARPWRRFIPYASLALLVIYMPLFVWRYMDKHFDEGHRDDYTHFIGIGKMLDSNVDKVYYASKDHVFASLDFFVSHYFATPVKVESDSYFSESREFKNADALSGVSPEAWVMSLKSKYTHFYLHSYAESFPAEYGTLFSDPAEIAPRSLYRVEDAGGRVMLVKMSSY